jgi:sodium/potassium/calcium exchanger 6
MSFVMSIVWIWFIANILVDILKIYGDILGINTAFLGITILAFGNQCGDMMANVAIAKRGFGSMAITGCFAGPLFDLLIGLTLATLKLYVQFGEFEFKMNS